jgi:lysophospholipase L1-like esterase
VAFLSRELRAQQAVLPLDWRGRRARRIVLSARAQRILWIGWLLIWIFALLAGVELYSRRYLRVDWVMGRRPVQPYLAFGDFYEGLPLEVMQEREGPECYGYRQAGSIFVHSFEARVESAAERGTFLFQDRAELANLAPRADLTRIFVLGGSVASGTGASAIEKRWYVALERALSDRLGHTVRAVPAAMGAYVSTQERLVLDLMVLPRRPDAVIILDGFNDAIEPAEFGARPGDPYNQGVFYEDAYHSVSFALKKWLAQRSYFCRYLLHRSLQSSLEANRRAILADPRRVANYAQSVASVYLDNVLRMLQTCAQNHVRCMVFVQPARALTLRRAGMAAPLDSAEQLGLLAYEEVLRRVHSLPAGTPLYDLTAALDALDARDLFLDSAHFRDRGHAAIAEAMFPVVARVLRQDFAKHRGAWTPKPRVAAATTPHRAALAGNHP